MPKQDSHFSTKWFKREDGTRKPCSRWLKPGQKATTFFCIVCKEEKSCRNGGWSDVQKHFRREKHLQRLNEAIRSGDFLDSDSFVTMKNNSERILTDSEKVTRAEVFWALATAKLGLSYNASQYIQELFVQMFSDSDIAKRFTMKPRKLSYVLSHGTGHYFTQMMLRDLSMAPGYTLIFDETVTVSTKKQLDLHFRYWCERKQSIVVRYYKSIFLGHSTAEIQSQNIIDSLRADDVDLSKMLMLGTY